MAGQRFGGKYSPDGSRPSPAASDDGAAPTSKIITTQNAHTVPRARPGPLKAKGQWRATLLFLCAFLFLFPAFKGGPSTMVFYLLAGGLLILAAWLTREGMRARAAFEARRTARRPAAPRILLGAISCGAALFLGGMATHGVSIFPILYAGLGVGLHLAAFGLDPMQDKGMEGIDRFQTDRVAKAVAGAEKTLAQMKDAILRAKDRQLEARVDRFADQARVMMRRIEDDPGDLTSARKFLTVYLEGARDATVKFADIWATKRDMQARKDYETLLGELEHSFAQASDKLLTNDRDSLEIEISVLRDRLKFETSSRGTTPPQV